VKTVRLAVLVLSVLAARAALAQSEGVAEFRGATTVATGQSIPSHSRVSFSGASARVDVDVDMSAIAGGSGSGSPGAYKMTIIQKASEPDRMYMLNDAQKTYSVTHLDKPSDNSSGETFTVKKTGSDKVAGLPCEKAMVTSSSGSESELCVTKQLVASTAWLNAMNRRTGGSGMWKALRDNGLEGFPIRIVTHHGGGSASQIELVSFQKTSVPSSTFQIPAGYKESASQMQGGAAGQDARRKAIASMTPEQRKQLADMLRQNLDKAPSEQRKAIEAQIKELEGNQ
jgi:uncharacterized protein DUF4412